MIPRLLIDATAVTPTMDGLGLYSYWLTKKLIESLIRHFEICVAVSPSSVSSHLWGLEHRVKFIPAPSERHKISIYSPDYFDVWNGFVYSIQPDVYVSAAYLSTTFKCHRAVVIHDIAPLSVPELIAPRKVIPFSATMHDAINNVEIVLCPSKSVASEIREAFPGKNIVTLYPDISALIKRVSGSSLVSCYDNYDYVVIGVKCPRKNIQLALDAFALLQPDYDFRVALVGNLRLDDVPVLHMIENLNLSSCVDVLGYVSDESIKSLMANARALIFPTRYEGFGLPAFESMVLGTPVVCLRLSVFEEILGFYPIYADNEPKAFAGSILKAIMEKTNDVASKVGALQKEHNMQFSLFCEWLKMPFI